MVSGQTLQANSPGAAKADRAALHIRAIAFIHRFGSCLNEHVHFHVCVVDGVFEEVAGEGDADDEARAQARSTSVIFHPATGVDADAVDEAQASLRLPLLRAFVGRGLLEGFEAKEMLAYRHSGFSVDTSVCIAAQDRAGLERLLRYCARPPFASERLRKAGSELVYRCAKLHSEPGSERRDQRNANRGAKHGAQADELHLTPLELIARIAALVPPPRTHRHRYFGVLAPNSPLRPAVTALAQDAVVQPAQVQAEPASTGAVAGAAAPGAGNAPTTQAEPTQPVPPKRPAHYLWAVLTGATRKPVRALSQPQTGTRRPNLHRTLRSISASDGKRGNSGFANAARQGCARHHPDRGMPTILWHLARCKHPSRPQHAGLRCPNPLPYLCSCGWISYPFNGPLRCAC